MTHHIARKIACTVVMLPALVGSAQQPGSREPDAIRARESATRLVAQIQRADYEGDRRALQRLYDELAPLKDDTRLAPRVRYWQGFALWRKTFNGFNESADPKELEHDLQQALGEFREVAERDPSFVDANVGIISCLQTLLYLNRNDATRVQEFVTQIVQLFKESLAAAPGHPRLLWVLGVQEWYSPPEKGGGQEIALATFEKGLQSARTQKGTTKDPLEPAWGEPELLMNLAWGNLNRKTPNVKAAKEYARQALELVPYWHYLRDILMPQIERAKEE